MSDTPESTTPESKDGSGAKTQKVTTVSIEATVTFAQASQEEQPGLVREFVEFLVESKAWWLTPIIIVLLLVGLLVVLSGSVVAPFIYPIF
jgi:hypothetical protein